MPIYVTSVYGTSSRFTPTAHSIPQRGLRAKALGLVGVIHMYGLRPIYIYAPPTAKTLKTHVPHRPGVTAATWAAATEPTSPDDNRAPTTTVSVPDTYSIPDNQYMPDISPVWSLLLHTGLYS